MIELQFNTWLFGGRAVFIGVAKIPEKLTRRTLV
jgi:hypothetical protein